MELTPETLDALVQSDPDRVRAAQLAVRKDRDALMVIYAFHAELAKVPELVSEPIIGQIRYQWWRDAVEEIYSGKAVRRHEVATPLAKLVEERKIQRFHLDRLIDGRQRDLDPRPFADMEATRDYAQATSGALMQLASHALGGTADAFTHAGEAWGLTGLARGYRFYKGSMLQHLDPADILAAARDAHQRLGRRAGRIPGEIMPAVAYAALVPGYIKAMSRAGHDPATDSVDYGAFKKQARMMRAAMTGRV